MSIEYCTFRSLQFSHVFVQIIKGVHCVVHCIADIFCTFPGNCVIHVHWIVCDYMCLYHLLSDRKSPICYTKLDLIQASDAVI